MTSNNSYSAPAHETVDIFLKINKLPSSNDTENRQNLSQNTTSNKSASKLLTLKYGFLNVCGLRRRLMYPDFCDKLKEYDIFGVVETKLDKYDVMNVKGYSFLQQPRKQNIYENQGALVFSLGIVYFHTLQYLNPSPIT